MSFILEALRKSEGERHQLGNVALADLPVGRRRRGQPWWVFAIGALLALNLIVLSIVLMRDKSPPQTAAAPRAIANNAQTALAAPTNASPPMPAAAPAHTLQEAATPAPQVQVETVPSSEMEIANAAASVPDGPALVRARDANAPQPASGDQAAPIVDAVANAELHLELHVYSTNARNRFVRINGRRYNEGQILPNGATVEQITPEGAVIYQNGARYLLDRR